MSGEVNIPLLRKAVEWAEAEAAKPPELCQWMQSVYFLPAVFFKEVGRSPECGSCYCIAGYIASLEGPLSSHTATTAPFVAAEALGVPYPDLAELFMSTNTIADVRRIAEDLAGERL